jgi:hypothetical protein
MNKSPNQSSPLNRDVISEDDAYNMGAKGAPPTEAERLLFEAWMRGHCWAVEGDWNGKQYIHTAEADGFIHGGAMSTRRLWAAWRDRAALSFTAAAAPIPCQIEVR